MKLAVGTAQFGMSYGVANYQGQISLEEAQSILGLASNKGIHTIDTAMSYGTSENTLGIIGITNKYLITKLNSLPESIDNRNKLQKWINKSIELSLKRLKRRKIDTLLLHHPDDIFGQWGDNLIDELVKIQQAGFIDKLGVSIYDINKLEIIRNKMPLQVVQCPLNIFDRRLEFSGMIEKLSKDKVEIHIRSAFLQGLLLMKPEFRPPYFKKWQFELMKWDQWIGKHKVDALDVCLAYLKSLSGISYIIVGVDSLIQFEQIIKSFSTSKVDFPNFHFSDKIQLINPGHWSIG